jgi:hypothetical protein
MRRPLTGYAVTFNLRHRRTGHLFQNRYKSIVCEEEPYLLELVRYIHLNSLRAGTSKFLQSETKNWKRLERPESKNGRRKNVAPFSIIKSRQPDIFNPLTQQGQLSTSG